MRLASLFFLFPSLCFAGDWSKEDIYRQSALTTLLVADWAQTRWTVRNPERFREGNKVIGDFPSTGKVNNYFALSIVSHAVISNYLHGEWRKNWQYVWIGVEVMSVSKNYALGVKMDF